MHVIQFKDADKYEPHKGWLRASICDEKNISIEYFVKPPKHSSPLHQHPQAQVCVVIKGKMVIRNEEGEESVLDAGSAVYFEPDEPHSITNAIDEESHGIDIFVPSRSFDFWLKRKT